MDQSIAKVMIDGFDRECRDQGRKSRQEHLCWLIDCVWEGEMCDCGEHLVPEGKSFPFTLFVKVRDLAYLTLWREVSKRMREAMSAALREGRMRHVRSKSEDDLEERLGTVSAEMVAAAKAVVVVKDGDNEGEEMPALRIEVF